MDVSLRPSGLRERLIPYRLGHKSLPPSVPFRCQLKATTSSLILWQLEVAALGLPKIKAVAAAGGAFPTGEPSWPALCSLWILLVTLYSRGIQGMLLPPCCFPLNGRKLLECRSRALQFVPGQGTHMGKAPCPFYHPHGPGLEITAPAERAAQDCC